MGKSFLKLKKIFIIIMSGNKTSPTKTTTTYTAPLTGGLYRPLGTTLGTYGTGLYGGYRGVYGTGLGLGLAPYGTGLGLGFNHPGVVHNNLVNNLNVESDMRKSAEMDNMALRDNVNHLNFNNVNLANDNNVLRS